MQISGDGGRQARYEDRGSDGYIKQEVEEKWCEFIARTSPPGRQIEAETTERGQWLQY